MIRNDIPALLAHVQMLEAVQVKDQAKILDVYENEIGPYVEAELQKQLEADSFERARKRMVSLNLLPRVINKTAKIYSEPVKRTVLNNNELDKKIWADLTKELQLDNKLATSQKLYNLHRYTGLEPYFNPTDGSMGLRVLSGNEFCVYSNDDKNPLNPTHVIKFGGTYMKTVTVDLIAQLKQVNIYYAYTVNEFVVFDSDGEVRQELMPEDNPEGVSELGMLPIIYVNSSETQLIPSPDNDLLNMFLIVSVILSDVAYAIQYSTHSQFYGIDLDVNEISGQPDAFWNFASKEGQSSKPQLGVIKAECDSDKVFTFVANLISLTLDSRGIKPGSVGSLTAENAASGIAKMIDESDITQIRKEQAKVYKQVEEKLAELIKRIYNARYTKMDQKKFGSPLRSDFGVSVEFTDQKPIQDPKTVLETLKLKLDMGLTSRARALKEANPDLTDIEIKLLLKEIDEEKAQLKLEPSAEAEGEADEQEDNGDGLGQDGEAGNDGSGE